MELLKNNRKGLYQLALSLMISEEFAPSLVDKGFFIAKVVSENIFEFAPRHDVF